MESDEMHGLQPVTETNLRELILEIHFQKQSEESN